MLLRSRLAILMFCLVFSFPVLAGNKFSSIFIPLPNKCVTITSIEENRVYVDDLSDCSDTYKVPIAQVNIDTDVLEKKGSVEIYYKGRLWKSIPTAKDKSLQTMVESVNILAYEGFYRDLEKQGVLKNVKKEDMKKVEQSLQQVESYIASGTLQGEVERYKDDLSKGVYSLSNGTEEDGESKKKSDIKSGQILADNERLYIFVSSSVPSDVVKAYVRDASLLNSRQVIFVLRGGVNGLKFMRPTVEWIYSVIKKDNCIETRCEVYPVRFQIDPFLFRRFNVERVPAVVYVRNVVPIAGYSEGLPETEIGEAFVSYGDVSLFYHLFVIGKSSNNERLTRFAEKFLVYSTN